MHKKFSIFVLKVSIIPVQCPHIASIWIRASIRNSGKQGGFRKKNDCSL